MLKLIVLIILLLTSNLLYAQTSSSIIQQGIVHYELKEYDRAIDFFQRALQFQQIIPENYIYLTSSHLLNQNPDLAIESATAGLQDFPESLRLKMMKGEALIQTDIVKAVPLFEEVLKRFNNDSVDEVEGIHEEQVKAYLSRIYQQLAVKAFENGEFSEAEEAYKSAKALDPGSLSIHNNLAYVLIKQEKWAEADEALNTGLDRFPTSENLLLMMAQVYEQRKKNDMMVTILGRLYKTDESNMNRAALYGKALLSANRAEEANDFFLEKIVEYPQERVLYETLLEINRQRFNQTGVLEVLRLQKEQFPNDEQVLEEYGLELITAQQYAEASTWFDSLAVTKDRPDYAQTAARSWLYEEDFDSAERCYRKYLDRWPGDLFLMSDLGIVLKMNGKSDEAAEILKQVLEEKDSPKLRVEYAELLATYQEKRQVLEPIGDTLYDGWARWIMLREYPDRVKEEMGTGYIDILTGMIAFYEDRKKLAQAEVEEGLKTFRAPSPPLFQVSSELTKIGLEVKAMMNYLNRKKSHKVAEDVYLKALHTYPDSALLKHYLGMLYYQNNLYEDARIQFEHTARLQPDYEESHLYLGKLYAKSGEFTKAVLSFERVLTLNDRNENAYRSLVRLHQNQGQLDALCSRWISRYHHQKENPVLREYLIEALHRANQIEEARALLD